LLPVLLPFAFFRSRSFSRRLAPIPNTDLTAACKWLISIARGKKRSTPCLSQIHEFEKEKGMTFITTAERVGIKKGLLAGIELGLKLRFAAEGLALMPEIRNIQDADLLQQVLASIEHADTPEAVRRVWAKR
jgi:hypothetical protein